MNQKDLLFSFENKVPDLFKIEVDGVPIYAGLRDGVAKRLCLGEENSSPVVPSRQNSFFVKRIWDSFFKFHKFKNANTLVFTSAIFRRDRGRNLAAEYLLEKYPHAVIFEWPSKERSFDIGYFQDQMRSVYCPIDYYLVCYKIHKKLKKKFFMTLVRECRKKLEKVFEEAPNEFSDNEQAAIRFIMEAMPESYAETVMSHDVFRVLFRKYRNVQYAIDFWGGARENIIPTLPNHPQSIELQHGIITEIHPGYIYPSIKSQNTEYFFDRTLLVYGEKTKEMLIHQSLFRENQIDVIGNPRLKMYERAFGICSKSRDIILFTSGPYEEEEYYENSIAFLKEVQHMMGKDTFFKHYKLGIKLHPREHSERISLYKMALSNAIIYDNSQDLYSLLSESFVHITVASTVLYEAAYFNTPTICIHFRQEDISTIYGFSPWFAREPHDLPRLISNLKDSKKANEYTDYLKNMTKKYM